MKIFLFLLLSLNISFAQKVIIPVGINVNNFFSDKNHSKLVLKIIEKNFNHKQDQYKINFVFYKNKNKIINDFVKGKIKLLVINPELYFKEYKKLKKLIKEEWTIPLGEKKFEQYYLVKNIKSKATLKNLSSYEINFRDGLYSSKLWFKNIIYKEYKQKYKNIIKKEKNLTKANKLVLEPFFDKKNISVIPRNDYELMKNLNPQIGKKLKVIKKSKPIFLTILGLTHKDIEKEKYKKVYKKFSKVNYLQDVSQLKSLTNLSSLFPLSTKELKPLKEFLKELHLNKKKYE